MGKTKMLSCSRVISMQVEFIGLVEVDLRVELSDSVMLCG